MTEGRTQAASARARLQAADWRSVEELSLAGRNPSADLGACARLALDVLHQQLDQPRFEQQPGLVGRPLDSRQQVGLAHGAQQVHAGLDQAGENLVRRQLTQAVGPQRDHEVLRALKVHRESPIEGRVT